MQSCPECDSKKINKDGFWDFHGQSVQRYLCKQCGYRFSNNHFKECQTIIERQICVSDKKMKNLTRANEKSALQKHNGNTKSNLVNFSWHLTKLGRSEATIRTYGNYLKNISELVDLNDPEAVKGAIATHYKNNSTKQLACYSYDAYLKFINGDWIKPRYTPEHKLPFIPTENELQLAINTGHKENMLFTKFLYETGARSNEAQRLEWTALNIERNQVAIKSSKHGNSRIIRITEDLMKSLCSLPKTQETVFLKKPKNTRSSSFHNRMKRLAKIYDNPRFLKIHLHILRHCKALREYHKTKDLLYVKDILGHKKIETTMIYVRLYNQIYKNQQADQFITKIGSTKEERIELMNDGWDLVEKDDNDWYFRKPK